MGEDLGHVVYRGPEGETTLVRPRTGGHTCPHRTVALMRRPHR